MSIKRERTGRGLTMILLHISQKDGGGAAGGGSTHNLRFTRQRVNEMSHDVITSVDEIGEIRVSVAFVCLSVCLFVCLSRR